MAGLMSLCDLSPAKLTRSCSGPALESTMKRAAFRKSEQVGNLAHSHFRFPQVPQRHFVAHFIEQLLMRSSRGVQLSLERTGAHSQLCSNAIKRGITTAQFIPDQILHFLAQAVLARKPGDEFRGMSIKDRT